MVITTDTIVGQVIQMAILFILKQKQHNGVYPTL
jgi:hypothetical protein